MNSDATRLLVIVLGMLAFGANGAVPVVDHWGSCPASPAVVNTVSPSPLQEIMSLRGEWEFVTDPHLMGRHRMGKARSGTNRTGAVCVPSKCPVVGKPKAWANRA